MLKAFEQLLQVSKIKVASCSNYNPILPQASISKILSSTIFNYKIVISIPVSIVYKIEEKQNLKCIHQKVTFLTNLATFHKRHLTILKQMGLF